MGLQSSILFKRTSNRAEKPESIPDSWECIKFTNSIEKISTANKKVKKGNYLDSGEIPVIDQGQDFIGGFVNNKELRIECNYPYIIFGDHTKVIKYINFDFVAGADGIKVLKPNGFYYPKLFFYFLSALPLPDKGYARHYKYLKKSFIPVPPYNEQKRIVAKIEELFSKLDAGVEALKKIKKQLKNYRQSVLKAAFEGKLTEEWRSKHINELEQINFLLKKIKNEKQKYRKTRVKIKPIKQSELSKIPKEWQWTRLENLSHIIMGNSPPSSTYNKKEDGLPFFQGSGNFKELYPKIDRWCSKPNKIAQKNDILMSVRAPPGPTNLCSKEACIGRGLAAIRSLGGIPTKYLLYYFRLNEKKISSQGTGTTFNSIRSNELRNYKIPIPPLKEQQFIVEEIERRLSIIDKIRKIINEELKKAENLRHSILKKAFKGELVPQDPDDEPAEELLKRIRNDKER